MLERQIQKIAPKTKILKRNEINFRFISVPFPLFEKPGSSWVKKYTEPHHCYVLCSAIRSYEFFLYYQ